MKTYSFREIENCEMCNDSAQKHKVLGQRLDKTQGLRPKKLFGISVSVMRCSNCSLIYSNPQPIPESIQDHYSTPPEEYWKEEYFQWEPNYFSQQIEQAKKLISFKNKMKALDIGAGLGKSMMSLEKAGFDTFGFEPSEAFYERAISEMKIDSKKLSLGAIEDISFEENQFDFITFGAVFEHLYEPAKCLEKAMKWLKPNGVIHIEVPSSKWLLSSVYNFYYLMIRTNYVTNLSPMHVPYHLYEFDIKSFKLLGEQLNFKIEKHHYDVCSIFFLPKIFHPILRWYMRKTNRGLQLTVFLQKN